MRFTHQKVDAITPDLRGFYRIDHAHYHDGLGISSSRLKKALISHAAYHYDDRSDSSALSFGRAFHQAILEPDLFARSFVVSPQFDGHPNSNSHKAAKADWLAKNIGREILSSDDATTIAEMIRTVKAHPEYVSLNGFEPEIMAITDCLETGLKIKCKADLLGSAIIDFKTTSSGLQPTEFTQDVAKWGYHISAAFYQDIVQQLTGEKHPFILVPVTKKPPFDCEFYELSDELLHEGRMLYKTALRRIAKWQTGQNTARKRKRTLYPNARILYSTKDILEFIGDE